MSDTVRTALRRRLVVLWAVGLVAALVSGPLLVDSAAFGISAEQEGVVDDGAALTDDEIAASWDEDAVLGASAESTDPASASSSEELGAGEATAAGTPSESATGSATDEAYSDFVLEFADGTVLEGSTRPGAFGFSGNKNEAEVGLSQTVHVSCSDNFHLDRDPADPAYGWGEAGAPVAGADPHPLVSYSITKYKDGAAFKTCRGAATPPTPPPPPPPVELPAPAVDVEKHVSVDGTSWTDADAPTGPEVFVGANVWFRFEVTNTGEVPLNNIALTDSDFALPSSLPSTLGVGESFSTQIGPIAAVEGQHVDKATVTAEGSALAPHSYTGKRNQYTIVFADGSVFEGAVDQGDVDLGLSQKTHISCSDGFGFNDGDPTNDGWGEKSAPVFGVDPYPIVKLHITRYTKGGEVKVTCGHDDPTRPISVGDHDYGHYLGVVPQPAVDIEKATNGIDADSGPGPVIAAGAPVTWTYVVTNTGETLLTDIEVTDDQIGAICTIDELAVGASATCSAEGVAEPGDYRNTGMVTAFGPRGKPVTDHDDSHYRGADPSVDLEKFTNGSDADTGPGPFLRVGSDVLWTYTVTNTGNVELTHIVVTDDRIGNVCTIPSLGPGNTFTCSAQGTAEAGQYTNLGTVLADAPGAKVQDSDPSHYFGWQAGVDIEKATDGFDADTVDTAPTLAVGATVTWTYVVTNTGNVALANIIVTDDQIPTTDISCDGDSLQPGESLTCTATGTVRPGDVYRNLGSVAATPVDRNGNPLAPKPVTDSDPSHYVPQAAALVIEKATNGVDADEPTGPEIGAGDPVTWSYVVTNTGGMAIADLTVTDSDPSVVPVYIAGDTDNDGLLDPGESWTFEAIGQAIAGQYRNVGTASGQPVTPTGVPVGDLVHDDDPSHYFGVAMLQIGDFVWLDADGDGQQNDGPDSPLSGVQVLLLDAVGDQIAITTTDSTGIYGFLVTPGDYAVQFVAPAGHLATAANVGDDATDSDIDASGRTATYTVVADDLTIDAGFVAALPGIDIEKATNGVDADDPADAPLLIVGEQVTWTYVVTNTGNVTLIDIVVDDNRLPDGAIVCPADALAPGESFTCEATGIVEPGGDFGYYRNVGSATGTPVDGEGNPIDVPAPSDDDLSHYVGGVARISIEKATNGVDADTPPGPEVAVGDGVTWTYVVRNDGGVPLADVAVVDSDADVTPVFVGGDDNNNGLLDIQETWTYAATGFAALGQYENLATVTATPADLEGNPIGDPVTDDDPSHYVGVETPLLRIGDFVWHDFNGDGVQNDGPESPLTGVAVALLDDAGAVLETTSTDGNGEYGFLVEAGTYRVAFTAPDGTVPTFADQGSDDTADSDIDAAGRTALIEVTVDDLTIDAGFYIGAALGDFAWHDFNGNGLQDDGSGSPLGGVGVALLDAAGEQIAVTTTASDGSYLFDGLAPGTYSVRFTPLDGTVFTVPDAGDDAADSDADPVTGTTGAYTLASGDRNLTVDAGFYIPAAIGDFVWDDLNRNGQQDAGEPGVAGVAVTLLDGDGVAVATQTTDGNGEYWFEDLHPGVYQVQFDPPVGYVFTTPDLGDDATDSDAEPATGLSPETTLASGDQNRTVDAGLIQPGASFTLTKRVNGEDANEAPGPYVTPGSVVTFTFVVTNTGEVPLADVTVDDSVFGFVCTVELILPGESIECEVTAEAVAGQHTNSASATGTPVDDEGVPVGDPIDADDPGHYFGALPAIDIEKATNGFDADDQADAPLLVAGETVTWTYLVTNTGNVDLAAVTVTDNRLLAGSVVCPADTLAPGEFFECSATGIAEEAGDFGVYSNLGTATGTPVDGDGAPLDLPSPSDDDPSHYLGVLARINVEKATNGVDADAAPGPQIPPGSVVTWTYQVRNDGGSPLADVTVTDSDGSLNVVFIGGDDNGNGLLDIQELWLFEATGVAVDGQYANLGTATGTPTDFEGNPIGGAVSDDDPSHYNGSVATFRIGDFVWHDFNGDGFQNDGPDSPLSGVTVDLLDEAGAVLDTTATDADGLYGFDVEVGSYQLQFTGLPGTVPTGQDLGGNDAADSDIDATGRIATFSVDADDLTLDAGYVIAASLGDFVWNDEDRDGIQDAGEPGIPDVAVILIDAAGFEVAATVTDADGLYAFTDLRPGAYTVQFVRPDGWFFSPSNQGDDDSLDSDADPFDGAAMVTLGSGDADDTIDAGLSRGAFLGDFVWEDLDGDGIQDAGEPAIAGVTVRLWDGTGTVPLLATATDAAGLYRFGPLGAADYMLEFVTPEGYVPTVRDAGSDDAVDSDADPASGRTAVIALPVGADDSTWDAGFGRPATIGDFVWEDLDGDGIQDAGEPGVPGVAVTITTSTGDVITTATDAGGAWSATVPPGETLVVFTLPAGLAFTAQDAGVDDTVDSDADAGGAVTVSVVSGQDDLTIDAGAVAGANLGDLVWDDLDADGVQDAGEPGVSGVTVRLLTAGGAEIASTTTGTDGVYGFGVPPGTYVLEFVAPAGRIFTVADIGNDATDSDADQATGRTAPVTVASGESNLTIDAGMVRPAVIGNLVWEDLNGNGVINMIEPGVPGVTVELRDGTGAVVASTVTDANGVYGFTVFPGTYSVRFVVPDEWTITTPNATDDAFDSDADPATGETPQVTLASGDIDLTIDAGVWKPALIGDFVWEDLDRDGIQDPGEPPVPGVTVRLRSGGQELATTVTDAGGRYDFVVDPGRYRVVFDTPGWVLTTQNAGADDVDSDPDPANGRTVDFAMWSNETDLTWDAGVYKLIDLQIDKQAVPDNIAATLDFQYIVTVTNLGPSDATDVVVLDLLPSRAVADPPYTGAFGAFPCFSDWVADAGDAQNCVGDEAFQVDTPQFETGEPRQHPSERGDEEIAPGVVAPQSVTLTNITAPAGVECAYDASVNGVRCDVGDLTAGESLDIVFDVSSHPLNRVRVWNRAWVYAAEFETNLDNTDPSGACAADAGSAFGDRGTGCNYVKKNEEITPEADLTVAKSVSSETAAAGDQLVYTITASNAGPFAAAAVAVVDSLPAGVNVLSLDDGCSLADGVAECAIGLMMPGDTVTRTITVGVTDEAGRLLTNTVVIENREDAETGPSDPNPANNSATVVTEVPTGVAIDLEVAKTVTPAAVTVDDEATFVVTVSNLGPDDATGVVLTDVLPAGLEFVSATGSGSYDPVSGVWTVGEMPAGATASLSMVVTATSAGAFTNVAEVTAADQDDVDSVPADGEGDDVASATLDVTAVLPQTVTTTTAAPETLPRTGLETSALAAIGGALFAFGLALVAAVRRRDESA